MVFSRLSYPDRLTNSTVLRFIAVKASDQPVLELPAVNNEVKAVPIVLPFKEKSQSADIARAQLKDPSQKIQVTVQPAFVSHKIKHHLKPREVRPPIGNQQSLLYHLNVTCVMQVMLVTRGGICINALTSTRMRLPPWESISVWNILMCPLILRGLLPS